MKLSFAAAACGLLAASLAGCRTPRPADSAAAWVELPPCSQPGGKDYYIGVGNRRPSYILDDQLPALLRAAVAPSISCGPGRAETYRLSFIPTNTPAFVITVTRDAANWLVAASEFALATSSGKGRPFAQSKQMTRSATDDEVAMLRRGLERAQFSTMPTELGPFLGADGMVIAVEARTPAGYHVVMRIAPSDGPFARTAYMFFDLAGLPYPDVPRLPWQH